MPSKPILLAALLLFILGACQKEEETTEDNNPGGPTVEPPYSMLHYDASNMDAPLLGSGTFEGAARFEASQISAFAGGTITKVWFYLKELPQSCEVRIYLASDGASSPDSLIYSANVTSSMEASRWNDHEPTTPIEIPNNMDLWTTIRFSHNSDTRSLGCDPGPAVDNGDRMWTSTGGNWITLRQYDGTNINWNIRTVVLP